MPIAPYLIEIFNSLFNATGMGTTSQTNAIKKAC